MIELKELEYLGDNTTLYRAVLSVDNTPWWMFWTKSVVEEELVGNQLGWYIARSGASCTDRGIVSVLANALRKQEIDKQLSAYRKKQIKSV